MSNPFKNCAYMYDVIKQKQSQLRDPGPFLTPVYRGTVTPFRDTRNQIAMGWTHSRGIP